MRREFQANVIRRCGQSHGRRRGRGGEIVIEAAAKAAKIAYKKKAFFLLPFVNGKIEKVHFYW